MSANELKLDQHQGFALDVWCDFQKEAEILAQEISFASENDPKRVSILLHELGRVQLASGNETGAAQSLLRAYSLRPQARPTLRLAQLMYRQRGDYRLVSRLLEAEARATNDPLARSFLIRQQARLIWSRLGDLDTGRKLLESSLKIDAASLSVLKLYELFCILSHDDTGQMLALNRQLELLAEDNLAAALLVDIAHLQFNSGSITAALQSLVEAKNRAPTNLAVKITLEQYYEQEKQATQLAELLVELSHLEQLPPPVQARFLARAARLWRFDLNQRDRALDLITQSMTSHPLYSVAADCFSMLVEDKRFAEAVMIGETIFNLDESPAWRAEIACHLGDIYRRELQNPDQAIAWYRQCLRWSPRYQPALEGLGWLLETRSAVDDLLSFHRVDLANTHQPQAQAQCLYRIANLLERHDQDNAAIDVHKEALACMPGFTPALTSLERLLIRAERWSELLQILEEQLTKETDRERRVHLLETMASLWYHQLGHVDNAIECYERLLEISPQNTPVIRAFATICAESRRFDKLVDLGEKEASQVSEPTRRVELLQRTGEIWEYQLLNLDQAIDCYKRTLAIDPSYLPALRALGRLFRQKGRWTELIEMHRAEILHSSDPEHIVNLLYDIAEIAEEELLDEEMAAQTYQTVLERQPNHLPSVIALSRIYERLGKWKELASLLDSRLGALDNNRSKALCIWQTGLLFEEKLKDHQAAAKEYQRAFRMYPDLLGARASLISMLEENHDATHLAEYYAAFLDQAKNDAERYAFTLHLAELWERELNNLGKAAAYYERLVDLSPTPWTLWNLAQVYEGLGAERELCQTLERIAALVKDDRLAAELHLKVGLYKQYSELGDPLPHLAKALHVKASRPFAQRMLERAIREQSRSEDLADLLVNRIESTRDPVDLSCLWSELGEIYLQLGDTTGAEHAFLETLKHLPDHLSSIWMLSRIYEEQNRWAECAELAEREASVLESSRSIADALTRAALIWEDKVKDSKKALPIYRRVLKILPGHDVAFTRLHHLLEMEEDWNGLASLIRAQISSTNEPSATAEMFTKLGRIYLDKLEQPRKASACLQRALEFDAENIYLLRTLGHIAYLSQNWDEALDMYLRARDLEKDPTTLLEINQRLGDVYLNINQPAAAMDAYQRAMNLSGSPAPEMLRRLVQAAQLSGDVHTQVNTLKMLADSSPDPDERVRVRKQMANLAAEHLDEDELAVEALEEAMILAPLDIETIEKLAAIYGRGGNREAVNQHFLAAVANHRAELQRRPFEVRLYQQLGRIFQWQKQPDRLYLLNVAQLHLGVLDEPGQKFLREHHLRCGVLPHGALTRQRFERMILPEISRGPIRDLLASLSPNIQLRAAVDPEALGIDRNAKLKPNHPLREVAANIAALFGGLEFEISICKSKPDLISAEMLDAPSLIIGSRVASSNITLADRFRIGRSLFLIAENAMVLRDMSVRRIRHLFAALAELASLKDPSPFNNIERRILEEEAKILNRILNRRDRKLLTRILPDISDVLATVDIGEFARALSFGANRAGLIAAGDPKIGLDGVALLSGSTRSGADMSDILQYLVSEEYMTLRVELGLTPGSK